ncbi:MAG: PP2C family protein-serine/threonine phosphatase [Ignavibacterium sp.]|jgi:serine phosphatase RsbU (regulator of sigma subunit)
MQRLKAIVPFLFVLVISVPVLVAVYPRAFPLGGLRLHHDSREAIEASGAFLDSLTIDVNGLKPASEFHVNRRLLNALHRLYGIDSTNALMQSGAPVGSWRTRWKTEESLGFTRDNSEEEARRAMENLRGQVSVELASDGGLLAVEQKIADSAQLATIPLDEARRMAAAFVSRWSALRQFIAAEEPVSEKTIVQPRRSDYEFIWKASPPWWPEGAEVKTLIAGPALSGMSTDFKLPERVSDNLESSVQVAVVILYVAVIGFMVVSAFKRFRSFEIGFRLAAIIGITGAIVMAIEILLSVQEDIGWGLIIALLLGPLFVGGGLALVWAVSESVGREAWKEKFISLDLLANGHVLHSNIGLSIVRGVALGILAAAVWFGGISLAESVLGIPIRGEVTNDALENQFEVVLPWLYITGNAVYTSAFFFSLFVLYALSILRRWLDSPVALIVGASLILALVRQGDTFPLGISLVLQAIVGAVFVWSFIKGDVLTSYLTVLTFGVVKLGGMLFVVGHPSYESSGMEMVAVFGIAVVGSAALQFRKKEITDFDEITPVFARHITERQRLQQELEIAREVQRSFLPKENPNIPGLDIDSICVPALEVGGDYYDFVRFSREKFAVALGDVSGKGTQAAFYMTLAKGFLRALSGENQSATKVLTQINRLFYANVERGSFISMIYGVFDAGARMARLTRAGHNPIYIWRARKKILEVHQPGGLALGLEDSGKFSRSIEEVRIRFGRGDCFVFYTDGITEAMNAHREEYGEHRLAEVLRTSMGKSSSEIIKTVLDDVKRFIGKEKQHDDMTMVVVRIV